MRRRELLALFGGAMAASRVARAQKTTPVIGLLSGHKLAGNGFDKGLSDTGFIPDENGRIVYSYADDDYDDLPQMAAALVRQKVDAIAAFGTTEALAAKRATSTIPIVASVDDDPIGEDLVTDLARPGGNITGILMKDAELMPKRLDLLLELVPKGKKFALLVNPKAAFTPAVIRIAQQAAHAKGIELYVLPACTDVEIDAAFAALGQLKPDGVIFEGDKLFDSRAVDGKLVTMAAHAAVPAVYAWDLVAWTGGLITYGADRDLARRQMGRYIGGILQGANPADLPFLQAKKIELCINTKTARALGISVPQSLLDEADNIIG